MDQSDPAFLASWKKQKRKEKIAFRSPSPPSPAVTSSFSFNFSSISFIRMTWRNRGWEGDTYFCLELVPQDGNLAAHVETKQNCLQYSLLLHLLKLTGKLK